MDEENLKLILNDPGKLDEYIENFKKRKLIFKGNSISEEEIKGHIEKAEHNLSFIEDNINSYTDWAVVGCYYALYHISLALTLKEGFYSKNHDATLCILIKCYLKDKIDKADITLINRTYLDNEDILFYAHSKDERRKASYSTQIIFDKTRLGELRDKTVLLVNKCKEVLKEKGAQNEK